LLPAKDAAIFQTFSNIFFANICLYDKFWAKGGKMGSRDLNKSSNQNSQKKIFCFDLWPKVNKNLIPHFVCHRHMWAIKIIKMV
jgi:hypothetical protein